VAVEVVVVVAEEDLMAPLKEPAEVIFVAIESKAETMNAVVEDVKEVAMKEISEIEVIVLIGIETGIGTEIEAVTATVIETKESATEAMIEKEGGEEVGIAAMRRRESVNATGEKDTEEASQRSTRRRSARKRRRSHLKSRIKRRIRHNWIRCSMRISNNSNNKWNSHHRWRHQWHHLHKWHRRHRCMLHHLTWLHLLIW